jgi:hypothetical protein
VEQRVEQVAPEQLQMDFAAFLQRQVGWGETTHHQTPQVVAEQAAPMVPVGAAAITHPADHRVGVAEDFLEQVGTFLLVQTLERVAAELAVRADL